MRENVWLLIVAVAVAGFVSRDAWAERIRVLVPGRPYEVSIDLKGFEADPMLQPKTILGGSTKDDIIVTVVVEQEKPGTTLAEVRTKYAGPGKPGIETMTIQTSNAGEMTVIFEPWKAGETMMKINGYVVKDELSFDIHLSADLAKHPKDEIVTILNSFQVNGSAEPADMESLLERLHAAPSPIEQETLLKDFVKKHPLSPWGYAMLGEIYFSSKQREQAKQAYSQALKNHGTQPLVNPMMLWKCYDGLGICCGMAGEYDESKRYIELGYELAQDLEDKPLLAASAYNLACWYAETNNAEKSIKYLKEAVEIDTVRKRDAKEDTSFKCLRENDVFKALVGE